MIMSTLETIKSWAKEYTGGVDPIPFIYEGVTYYKVGHNASHSFAIGINADGVIWRLTSGESGWDEEENSPTYETSVEKIADLAHIGYMGHF